MNIIVYCSLLMPQMKEYSEMPTPKMCNHCEVIVYKKGRGF